MKKIILFTLLMAFNLFAGELTGAGARALLLKKGIDPRGLENSGSRILAGELTGAGKNVDISRFSSYAASFRKQSDIDYYLITMYY